MANLVIQNVKLAGVAAALPQLETLSWEELGGDPEAFVSARRRGEVPYRRRAQAKHCQSDYAIAAANRLMAHLGWQPGEIDAVVMVTITPDYPIPATSIILQDRLKISKRALALDLPAGPGGFLHGLQVLASMLSAGYLKKGLLLAGEVSKMAESPDEGVYQFLHGHNGTACALQNMPGSAPMYFDSGGDGSAYKALYMPVGGGRMPPRPDMFSDLEQARFASEPVMDRKQIGDFAAREVPASIKRVLRAAETSVEEMDVCFATPLPLPAEVSIRRALDLPQHKYHSYLHEYGQCGSGSIPVAMVAKGAGRLRNGRTTSLLANVGAGLCYGSAIIGTDNLICPDIIEM